MGGGDATGGGSAGGGGASSDAGAMDAGTGGGMATWDAGSGCSRVQCSGQGTCVDGASGPICMCNAGFHAVGSACVSDTTDLSALASVVATMTPGVWKEVPSTQMQTVFQTRTQEDAIDARIWEETGPNGVLDLWCSSAFDGRRWYFGDCGGHNGYAGNELYAFDLATLTWTRLYDPSPISGAQFVDPVPVWGPAAAHQYDGFVYSHKANALFVFWPFPGNGASSTFSWKYDLNEPDPAKAWTSFAAPVDAMPGNRWDQPYYKTAEDPLTGDIIIYGGASTASGVAAFDPVALTYSRYGGYWDLTVATNSVADIDPVRRRMFSMNFFDPSTGSASGVLSIDIDATPLSQNQTTLGTTPPVGAYSCFIHHGSSGLMWAWSGGRETYTFDPDTATWTQYANAAGPAPTPGPNNNGPFQKCVYLPELDVLAGYNNAAEGVWLYRLP
jgi:hypothetical protein